MKMTDIQDKVKVICGNPKCLHKLSCLHDEYQLNAIKFKYKGDVDALVIKVNKEIEIEEAINECYLKNNGGSCKCH